MFVNFNLAICIIYMDTLFIRELENETKHQTQPQNFLYSKPVIVMDGLNHGHFASGDMPSNVRNHDLHVDECVTFDSAHETIARHVTDFIIGTIGQHVGDRLAALAGLKAAFLETKSRLQV